MVHFLKNRYKRRSILDVKFAVHIPDKEVMNQFLFFIRLQSNLSE